MMAQKAIGFCDDMVLACIDLRKGRTMRTGGLKEINKEPDNWEKPFYNKITKLWEFLHKIEQAVLEVKSPYQVGDELYVKEAYRISHAFCFNEKNRIKGIYLADKKLFDIILTEREWELFCNRKKHFRSTPGRFMYKSLARIFLPPIERITVQRPQDLNLDDIYDEGFCGIASDYAADLGDERRELIAKEWWKKLWNRLHGDGAYERNDWCFVPHWDASKIEVRR